MIHYLFFLSFQIPRMASKESQPNYSVTADIPEDVESERERIPLVSKTRRGPSMVGPVILSCVAFFCFGAVFGLIAFILASKSEPQC